MRLRLQVKASARVPALVYVRLRASTVFVQPVRACLGRKLGVFVRTCLGLSANALVSGRMCLQV
ncbi:MAG: hypothetical protein ACK56F_20125 [bacterium]